jgi:hypothetical protein
MCNLDLFVFGPTTAWEPKFSYRLSGLARLDSLVTAQQIEMVAVYRSIKSQPFNLYS